jgi:signal transduction histidine kinase
MFFGKIISTYSLIAGWLLIGVFGQASLPASAQTPELDSLRQDLTRTNLSDTSRVLTLKQLCWKLSRIEPKEADHYGAQGLALARRINFKYGEVYCLNNLAINACANDDLVKATHLYQQAMRQAGTSSDRRIAYVYTLVLLGLGRVRTETGNYIEASLYFRQALHRFKSGLHYSDADKITLAANNLSILYLHWLENQPTQAPDSAAMLAVRYSRQALGLSRTNQLPPGKVYCGDLTTLGQAYRVRHQLDSSVYYLQRSLALSHKLGDKRSHLLGLNSLAETRLAQQRYSQTVQLCRAAIRLSQQMREPTQEMESYGIMARALAATGNGTEAYRAAQRQLTLRSVLETADRRQALARLQVSFDTERKESRIRELTQTQRVQQAEVARQRQRFWLLGAVLLAVVIGLATTVALALRLRRTSKLAAAQRDELAATRLTQDALYAIIAHDLRSPVVAFSGLADVLNYYVEHQETARLMGLGERIQQAAQGLTDLLDNLLNWALSQRGELVAVSQLIPVNDLLTEMVALYHNAALAAQVTLTYTVDSTLSLWADPNMTRTILRNLLSNALRATPAGGMVQLIGQADGPAASLRIRDTGPGYPVEVLNAVTSSPQATRPGGGAGLGLSLSRYFATKQQGKLKLFNLPDGGAEAVLHLPQDCSVATATTPMTTF